MAKAEAVMSSGKIVDLMEHAFRVGATEQEVDHALEQPDVRQALFSLIELKADTSDPDLKQLAELKEMTLTKVKQRALEIRCDENALADCDEADDPKQAVIDSILLKMKASSALPRAKISDLRRHAADVGATEEEDVDVLEQPDQRQSLRALIGSRQAPPALAPVAAQHGTVHNRNPAFTDVVLWGLDHKHHRAKMPSGDPVTIVGTSDAEYQAVWRGQGGWANKHRTQAGACEVQPPIESNASQFIDLSKPKAPPPVLQGIEALHEALDCPTRRDSNPEIFHLGNDDDELMNEEIPGVSDWLSNGMTLTDEQNHENEVSLGVSSMADTSNTSTINANHNGELETQDEDICAVSSLSCLADLPSTCNHSGGGFVEHNVESLRGLTSIRTVGQIVQSRSKYLDPDIAGRIWFRFRDPGPRQATWWWMDDDNLFEEEQPGQWQRFRDPDNDCQYWWNSCTDEYFYSEENQLAAVANSPQ